MFVLSRSLVLVAALAVPAVAVSGCGGPPKPIVPKQLETDDGDGAHEAAVAAAVRPYLDAEVLTGVVVALTTDGKRQVYGFGAGPGGKPPTADTLYELGTVTSVYTALLLADAVQRREVDLDTPVASLLPPGVTAPVADKVAITLRALALHVSGLPRVPPSLLARAGAPDPYAGYTEDALYRDLNATALDAAPGTQIAYSTYGSGLLGHALARKLGGDFGAVLAKRVLAPLGLRDTYLRVPAAAAARRVAGTTDDLQPAPAWQWGVLAGAGGLISTARDQLTLVEAELTAHAGGQTPLRAPMLLTQEPQLENTTDNTGLGWFLDRSGRYWHNGGTGGFRSFVGFDPKTRRGVVLLASTATSQLDRLGRVMFDILDNQPAKPTPMPTAAQLAGYAGTYDFGGTKLAISATGKRLYLEGTNEPRRRMSPVSAHEFWIESLQAFAYFEAEPATPTDPSKPAVPAAPPAGSKITRVVFSIGGRQLVAPRLP